MKNPGFIQRFSGRVHNMYEEIANRNKELSQIHSFKDRLDERIQALEKDNETEPRHKELLTAMDGFLSQIIENENKLNQVTIWKKSTGIVGTPQYFPHRVAKNAKDTDFAESLLKEKEDLTIEAMNTLVVMREEYPGEYLMLEEYVTRVFGPRENEAALN